MKANPSVEEMFTIIANYLNQPKYCTYDEPKEKVFKSNNWIYKNIFTVPGSEYETIEIEDDVFGIAIFKSKKNGIKFIHCTEQGLLKFFEENKGIFEIRKLLKIKGGSNGA